MKGLITFDFGALIGAAAGAYIIWVGKDWMIKTFSGAEALKSRLQASIDALKK
jgi:hypothetical protein